MAFPQLMGDGFRLFDMEVSRRAQEQQHAHGVGGLEGALLSCVSRQVTAQNAGAQQRGAADPRLHAIIDAAFDQALHNNHRQYY